MVLGYLVDEYTHTYLEECRLITNLHQVHGQGVNLKQTSHLNQVVRMLSFYIKLWRNLSVT